MTELRIMVGIPGSGKSSYIKRESDRLTSQGQKVRVISRDAIRFSLIGENDEYFSKEKQVFEKFITSINSAVLSNTFDVIFVDATHLNVNSRKKLLNNLTQPPLCEGKVQVIFDFMDTDVEECIKRDALRTGRQRVGRETIYSMASTLTKPADNLIVYGNKVQVRIHKEEGDANV